MTPSDIRIVAELLVPSLAIAVLAPMRRAGKDIKVWEQTFAAMKSRWFDVGEAFGADQIIAECRDALSSMDTMTWARIIPDLPPVRLVVNASSGVWLIDVRAWSGDVSTESVDGRKVIRYTPAQGWPVLYNERSDSRIHEFLDEQRKDLVAVLPEGATVRTALLLPASAHVTRDLPLIVLTPATLRQAVQESVGRSVPFATLLEYVSEDAKPDRASS